MNFKGTTEDEIKGYIFSLHFKRQYEGVYPIVFAHKVNMLLIQDLAEARQEIKRLRNIIKYRPNPFPYA